MSEVTNFIHPTAIIQTDKIGTGNYFGPYVVIGPQVYIGDENRFESHVSVGLPPEHRGFFDQYGMVIIGHRNIIREFVTIHSGTSGRTIMGDDCIMLRGSHLSHDSVLENRVTVSCTVMIGGSTYIMKGANLGLGALLHQRTVIGSYSMVGMGTIVTKKSEIGPFGKYVGNPARYIGNNMEVSDETYRSELDRFRGLRATR